MTTAFEGALREAVATLGRTRRVTESSAFALWYAIHALHLEPGEAVEVLFDGGNDHGVDVLYVDDETERVVIAQTKYFKSSGSIPSPGDLALLLATPLELAHPQELLNAGRPDLADAARDYSAARGRGYEVQLHLVYPGPRGAATAHLERTVRLHNDDSARGGITAQLVTLPDLELLYEDYQGKAGRVATGFLAANPDTSFEASGVWGRSLTLSVPGIALKRLHEEHGNRLFDQNVRLFVGTRKGSVNAGIRDTLENPRERGNFWAYNNGITVVAAAFQWGADHASIKLTDFSIVNGCQTTVAIAESPDAELADVAVLCRILSVGDAKSVEQIIRYTNSQTPINVWDLSARDTGQQRLRREVAALDEPWFYALRRGEFEALQNKDDYGPASKRRVLRFPLSSQYLASLRGYPVEAYKDKARLFTAHRDGVFPPDLRGEDLVWAWTVGTMAEEAIDAYRNSLGDDEATQAILRRGAKFFVTYVAGLLIRERNGPTIYLNFGAARLRDQAMRERLGKYCYLATAYYVGFMRGLLESGNDLGTLLRNTETAARLERRVKERLFEEQIAPRALDEKLPRFPGVRKTP